MDVSSRLQIPDQALAGPSQSSARPSSRPVSATIYTSAPTPETNGSSHHGQSSSRRYRASHQVTSSSQPPTEEQQPNYRDVYSHPAAVAYAAAHPRRTIPKFGPYLLLQTLGEGEFGKVKLGLHSQWGEEVAVKLIRRGNIDTAVRMSKVEREIEVLRTLKHPNIVRLYDVIETDKYIGIILEYASGGELFDHILAHRYLKEKDAAKLFSQLISGVWYIHQKKIVHRDLKLENLLLDRHRNVIITDFGFANRFDHRADDLMQTSCGSPCYAAPELVTSEGMYVGSAVDVWSCGVILYAMLAGYLPFDDDPANPDGDNINLLYKYICSTPLTFPDYVSASARELLSLMLVPDPKLRATLDVIMKHPWLKAHAHIFERLVEDLERLAMEQHQVKRLAYQRQMKQQAAAMSSIDPSKMHRSHSARVEPTPASTRSRHHNNTTGGAEFFYESTNPDATLSSPAPTVLQPSSQGRRTHPASAMVVPTNYNVGPEEDVFGPAPTVIAPAVQEEPSPPVEHSPPRERHESTRSRESRKKAPSPIITPAKTSPEKKRGQRHTIQLEYSGNSDPHGSTRSRQSRRERERERDQEWEAMQQQQQQHSQEVEVEVEPDTLDAQVIISDAIQGSAPASPAYVPSPTRGEFDSRLIEQLNSPQPQHDQSIVKISSTPSRPGIPDFGNQMPEIPPPPVQKAPEPPILAFEPASPPPVDRTPTSTLRGQNKQQSPPGSLGSANSTSSRTKHRRGLSMDKIVGKLWQSSGAESDSAAITPQVNGTYKNANTNGVSTSTSNLQSPKSSDRRPSTLQVTPTPSSKAPSTDSEKEVKEKKASRRNTLTVMVEPFSRQLSKRTRSKASAAPSTTTYKEDIKAPAAPPVHTNVKPDIETPITPRFPNVFKSAPIGAMPAVPASTRKASKVMQWFRQRSKSRTPSEAAPEEFENISHPDIDMSIATGDNSLAPSIDKENILPPSSSNSVNETPSQTPPIQVIVTNSSPQNNKTLPSVPQTTRSAPPPPTQEPSVPATPNFRRALNMLNLTSTPTPPAQSSNQRGFNKNALRVHHGAVDQTTVTTGKPPEIMTHVTKVLLDMGFEVQRESEYKYRCIRQKRKKSLAGSASSGGLTAFTLIGSAQTNGVDKRGLPIPSSASLSSTGGMLRGLLMRRQSSQVSTQSVQPSLESESTADITQTSYNSAEPLANVPARTETIYGDRTIDQGDEVRFSVELTRIDGLDDTFSLDIRRLKGNLRSYKFLYDTVRERCQLSSR